MADIVLGLFTSHGPMLNVPASAWPDSVPKDKMRRHWYRGRDYSYDELAALPGREARAALCTPDAMEHNARDCAEGLEALAQAWADARPDACVIFGNDQRELILDVNQPMLSVYGGATFFHEPLDPQRAQALPPGVEASEWAYRPCERTVYSGLPDLAARLFELGRDRGFDLGSHAAWQDMPAAHMHSGTPHGFGFILQRVMRDHVVPTLPLLINTFYPPNQPTAKRCVEFGHLVAEAIEGWAPGRRVAIVASGGLSHFAIDEDIDRRLLDAMRASDEQALATFPDDNMISGTSEIRCWIAAAAALRGRLPQTRYERYVPAYRSDAGTGSGLGFVVRA